MFPTACATRPCSTARIHKEVSVFSTNQWGQTVASKTITDQVVTTTSYTPGYNRGYAMCYQMSSGISITEFAATHENQEFKILISDWIKHGDGTSAFVSYLVSSSGNKIQVRRRFQDFIQLHKWLQESFPACIIPTLPGKAHRKYVIGDRFSPEFLDRRIVALQSFVDRVNRHPILSKSVCFTKFLSADQMALVDTSGSSNRDSTIFDNFTEGLINVFAKPKVPDERFTPFRENLEKLEQNVQSIEKLHQKSINIEKELVLSFAELGGAFESLGAMETQVTDPLTKFGTLSETHVAILREKVTSHDLEYMSPMHNYVTYCGAVKELLRLRDQKQIDQEELQRFLNDALADRDRTRATGKSPGITGFFKDKINDFKGVDPEKTRRERLDRLEGKIEELQKALEVSVETSQAFSEQVIQELERAHTDAQLAFHEKGLAFWNEMIPIMDSIQLDD